jgi:multiple sugar transport system substrate-binding protein
MSTVVGMQRAIALGVAAIAMLAAGCGGGGERARATGEGRALTVWILENQPDRVSAARADVARFALRTRFKVKLVPIGDDQLAPRMAGAARDGTLPDAVQLPMASAHAYARQGLLNADAAQDVVDRLGEATFSARALSLLTSEGRVTAVPSDGWGQLLIYRKDLFDRAGLAAPRSLEDVRHAARRLDRGGVAGITLATGAQDSFTAETFEHVALAAGCQLVDGAGAATLNSTQCRAAFRLYVDLARSSSPRGVQNVESTRDAYFAGRAAMIFWSPFLLDAMAGLRDDAVPTCPQCRADPAYLAKHSGLVGPLGGPDDAAAQFGEISTWGITTKGDADGAKSFVEYMMSDGYLPWLGVSPQGKYPVRFGDRSDPDRFVREWAGLESGVDRKAPLSRFYSRKSIKSLGEGVQNFRRWGFEQGQAPLVGAMSESQPIPRALAAAIAGTTSPEQAARQAQQAVQQFATAAG